MAYYFTNTNNYGLDKKAHMSCFLSLLCNEIDIIICFMLAISIIDLALKWNNKGLLTKKNTVWFEPLNQKKSTDI